MVRKKRILNISGMAVIPIAGIAAIGLCTLPSFADSGTGAASQNTDKVTLQIETKCAFKSVGDAVAGDRTYTANGSNGNRATFSDDGRHDFNVACNQDSGYTVKAYATNLVNEADDTLPPVAFIQHADYEDHISAEPGTAIWTAEITGGNSGAIFGSSESNQLAIKSKDTVSAPTGDTFAVVYKAYVGLTTAPGTYTGKAVYTLAMNPPRPTTYGYTINYHANGGENAPDSQTGDTVIGEDTVVNLTTATPTKEGFTFQGWDTNPAGATVVYAAGAEVTVPEASSTLNLYAVWKANITPLTGTFQSQSQTTCAAATEWDPNNSDATTYTLQDSRDSKKYLVRKLADGNCWMVQNLALSSGRTLTSSDSDVSTNYPMPDSSTSGWSDNSTAYMWNGTKHLDATQNNTPTTNNTTSPENTGAYYSFLTATAGTGTGSSGKASSSICPKWWHLPTSGDDSKEFAKLYKAYSSTTSTFNEAFNVAFTGRCASGDCPYADGYANYWSASISSGADGYSLRTVSSSTDPSSSNFKRYGLSVRCMLPGV